MWFFNLLFEFIIFHLILTCVLFSVFFYKIKSVLTRYFIVPVLSPTLRRHTQRQYIYPSYSQLVCQFIPSRV